MAEPDWQRVQKKTFTRWMNAHLRARLVQVVEMYDDLQDGNRLCQLLEVLSGCTLKYKVKPRNRFEELANVQTALDFITDTKGIKLVGIGAEDVVEKQKTLVLGLIWSLILRLQINVTGEANDPLLRWVQGKLPSANISNLTADFKSGEMIARLVDACCSSAVALDKLGDDPVANCELAFEGAERKMGIPRLLDAQDMVQIGDDHSNRCYISLLQQYEQRHVEDTPELEVKPSFVFQLATEEPPTDVDVYCSITGKDHRYVAHITEEGEVISSYNSILGYIDFEGLQAASGDQYFLGNVVSDQMYDPEDEEVATIDRGIGSVHDALGSTIFSTDSSGHLKGHSEVYLGQCEGLGFRELDVMALLTLIIPDFFREDTQ